MNVLKILPTLQNTLKKNILIQEDFESNFSDFVEEEECILAFINPFLCTEQNILKMLSDDIWNLSI